MSLSVEALWAMPLIALIGRYEKARRDTVEGKFERHMQRAGWNG